MEDGTTGVKTGSDNMIATGDLPLLKRLFYASAFRKVRRKNKRLDFDGDGQTEKRKQRQDYYRWYNN